MANFESNIPKESLIVYQEAVFKENSPKVSIWGEM